MVPGSHFPQPAKTRGYAWRGTPRPGTTAPEFSKLSGNSATINLVPDQKTTAQQLAEINDKLDKLLALAAKAEKFLHNPIAAYQARRLGKLPTDG